MSLQKIKITPGFNSQLSQTANESGWFSGNLVRWKLGLLEKVGGWRRLFDSACAGLIRALHGWEDLQNNTDLLIGTDGGLQLFTGNTLYTLGFGAGSDSFDAGPDLSQFIATAGSTTVTIIEASGLQVVIGQEITTKMTSSWGGVLLPVNSTFPVISVTQPSTFTFNLPTAAVTTVSSSSPSTVTTSNAPQPLFNFVAGTTLITTILLNHGLSNGNMFTIDQATNINNQFGNATIFFNMAQGLSVGPITVLDANRFQFPVPSGFIASGAGVGTTLIPEGENSQIDVFVTPIQSSGFFAALLQYASIVPVGIWYLDNLGTNGLVLVSGGPLFVYTPPITGGAFVVNAGHSTATDPGTPQTNTGMFVAMPQAQVIMWGTEPVIGSGQIDPLLLRFSDAGSYVEWTASVSNQAGSYRLSRGSIIIGGIQAPQTTLIWTDLDIWSMSYIGPPLVYGFTVMGTGCGLVAPYARATLGRTTYWQGQNSFWTFGDSGVQPLPCPVWDIIFANLNISEISKCVAGANSSFHEVWFFYPSLNATECDSYVKFNAAENLWDYGTLSRSAWIDNSVYGPPLAGDSNFFVQQHEQGYDNDVVPMSGVFAQTGYAEVAEGDNIMVMDMVIPDLKWFGSTTGTVSLTLNSVGYPGDAQASTAPLTLTPTTEFETFRLRARQIAMRLDWAATAGFSARVEAMRFRVASSGKRP